jgi:hypothetical protein
MVRELSAKGVQVRAAAAPSWPIGRAPRGASPHAAAARQVPNGFATTAEAFRIFLAENGLDKRIGDALERLDVSDTKARSCTRLPPPASHRASG